MSIVSPLPLFPDEAALRRCRKCGEDKPLTAFAPRSDQDGQRRHTCRACKSKKPQGYAPYTRRRSDEPWPCAVCGELKMLDEFVTQKNKRFGKGYHCLDCDKKRQMVRRAAARARGYRRPALTPEQLQREYDGRRRRLYNLTPSGIEALRAAQDNGCALCRRAFDGPKSFNIDHDHETGQVRGLLCPGCNSALGRLGDNENGLKRALCYVLGGWPALAGNAPGSSP